jgi:DNA-binding IscR family transcriptional regulator
MLRDEKWISYAILVLKAVDGGANTIQRISHEVQGSSSYMAKVIATLRKGNLIDTQTTLVKPLDQINVAQLMDLADPTPSEDKVSVIIAAHLKKCASTYTVEQVLEAYEVAQP